MYVYLEVLGDFTDKSLKGKLPDEKLSRLLVPPNFTKSDCSGAESMGLLHASGSGLSHGKQVNTEEREGGRVICVVDSQRQSF